MEGIDSISDEQLLYLYDVKAVEVRMGALHKAYLEKHSELQKEHALAIEKARLEADLTITQIAAYLGRTRQTIHRELRRENEGT